jgi:phosphoesterase RecJ-like protein
MTYPEAALINQTFESASKIIIAQPDNPDGDSMGSAIALEQILMLQGKETELVCGVNIPNYLSYLDGWDRVANDLQSKFELMILVDTSALHLVEHLTKQHGQFKPGALPLVIIDHHRSEPSINYAQLRLNDPDAAATAEVIYYLAKQLKWELNPLARDSLAAAILSDTLGLTTSSTRAETVFAIAELVREGVSLSQLENARRDMMRKTAELVHYKGELLQRIEYYDEDRIALLSIPWPEIEHYSPIYNPSMLALDDMRLTTNTVVAVALKLYPDNKITGKIRTNHGYPIAAKLAEVFGGGGHDYASGFKLIDVHDIEQLKNDIITHAKDLINEIV